MTAGERYEALYNQYVSQGFACIGRDAYWPLDLAAAAREALIEAETNA